MIYCTLTINSTTLYTYENHQLTSHFPRTNCSEIVSQELGLINSSKTLVGSIPVSTNTATKLSLYFMKKYMTDDGSRDLVTIVSIAHNDVNKTFILIVLKNIMDRYVDFRNRQHDKNDPASKAKPGEFKLYMKQIIKHEELSYDVNRQSYNYGSTDELNNEITLNQIGPNQLLLANEEVDEVRQLMLDNITKLLSRGDKLNSLVDQTDRLNTSSLMFLKKAKQIKRRMWFHKTKFILLAIGGLLVLLYLFIASQCGFPLFNQCVN